MSILTSSVQLKMVLGCEVSRLHSQNLRTRAGRVLGENISLSVGLLFYLEILINSFEPSFLCCVVLKENFVNVENDRIFSSVNSHLYYSYCLARLSCAWQCPALLRARSLS